MIRPILLEISLFLAPFAAYAVFLWAAREGVFDAKSWPLPRIAALAIVSLILMLGSFLIMAQFGGAPPGSTYSPARVEDGKFVPGATKPGATR